MTVFQTTFELPNLILQGLDNGEYIRIGGVIRDARTKHIVAMLREIAPDISQASTLLSQAGSVASVLNLGVSIINLGVSVIGFALILKRLKEIEQRLKEDLEQIQENINHLHRKFDISVYANFRAALDLARDATTMLHPENRRSVATLAINRFLEAQHIYSNYLDISIKEDINFTDKNILSLSLTYMARARCYLELEEIKNALCCLQEGAKVLRCHVEKYVKTLLISQPIARTCPSFVGDSFVMGPPTNLDSPVKLYRLARICKWLDQELNNSSDDKSILLEAQGKNLVKFIQNKTNTDGFNFEGLLEAALPIAVVSVIPLFGPIIAAKTAETVVHKHFIQKSSNCSTTEEINSQELIKTVEKIEQIIETYNRFEAYLLEVQLIQQHGMSFQNWLELASHTQAQQHELQTIYIIPLQPLNL